MCALSRNTQKQPLVVSVSDLHGRPAGSGECSWSSQAAALTSVRLFATRRAMQAPSFCLWNSSLCLCSLPSIHMSDGCRQPKQAKLRVHSLPFASKAFRLTGLSGVVPQLIVPLRVPNLTRAFHGVASYNAPLMWTTCAATSFIELASKSIRTQNARLY